jgi:ATP-dependent Lon protease
LLVALSSALLGRSVRGGVIIAGHLTLGGSIEPIHNPVDLIERAFERGAEAILLPVSCRRSLADLSDDLATRVQTLFYADAQDALRKALVA